MKCHHTECCTCVPSPPVDPFSWPDGKCVRDLEVVFPGYSIQGALFGPDGTPVSEDRLAAWSGELDRVARDCRRYIDEIQAGHKLLGGWPSDEQDRLDEHLELQKDLFFTDPDVIAHVCAQLDMPNMENMLTSAKLRDGLDEAHRRAHALQEPERRWLAAAGRRASAIVQRRWHNEGEE